MGCSSSSSSSSGAARVHTHTIESSMEEVSANPVKGIVILQSVLQQSADEESAQGKVPEVLKLVPKALRALSLRQDKPIIAGCALIEHCVKLVNDPSIGSTPPTLDAHNVGHCMNQLSMMLKKAQVQSAETHRQNVKEDEVCSKEVKAVAGAMSALFKLEDHVVACEQEFAKSGLKAALACMQPNSGVTFDAQLALLGLFATFLERRQNADSFIRCQGTYVLLPYCDDPKSYGISREFQLACMVLLDTCINSGVEVRNKAALVAAIEKAKKPSLRNVHW